MDDAPAVKPWGSEDKELLQKLIDQGKVDITRTNNLAYIDQVKHKHFRSRETFLRSYEECECEPSAFVVDLRDAEYLDSSALGMLLLLRDFAASKGASVTLEHPRPLVARTLAASDFGHWFTVA